MNATRSLAGSQRGAALVTGLVFLLILTLLAVTGMKMARFDVVLSGYEQFYTQAMQAADAAIDTQVANGTFQLEAPAESSPLLASLPSGIWGRSTIEYLNQGMAPDGGYSDDVLSYRFAITSTGKAPPDPTARVTVELRQGVYVLAPGGGGTGN